LLKALKPKVFESLEQQQGYEASIARAAAALTQAQGF
jgi:hypothetical protein